MTQESLAAQLRASNDQPGLISFDSIPGAIVSFIACDGYDSGSSLEAIGATPVELEFDYELFTADGADVNAAVDEFEVELWRGVAEEIGLLSCTGNRRNHVQVRGHHGQWRGVRMVEAEPELEVMGVSSEPEDIVALADCTTKMRDSSNLTQANCNSIKGYMTAWLPPAANRRSRHLSESQVYDAIQDFISLGYSSQNIVGVHYIPPPEPTIEPETDAETAYEADTTAPTDSQTGSQTVSAARAAEYTPESSRKWDLFPGIGLLALVVSLIALVTVAGVVRKRKARNSNDSSPEGSEVNAESTDPEISSEIPSQPPTPQKKHVEFSEEQDVVSTSNHPLSDTDDDDSSVATEDYATDNYTKDEYIQRIPTVTSSAWGDRERTLQSEAMASEAWSGRVRTLHSEAASTFCPESVFSHSRSGVVTRCDDEESEGSMPSEIGEEVGADSFVV